MKMSASRLGEPLAPIVVAPGWALDTLVAPTPLAGANGLRIGPDGALYVAQSHAGQVGRIDLGSGSVNPVAMSSGGLIGPDDLAFDSRGNMFVTEVMGNRVSARRPNGRMEVIAGDTPAANGITVHADRIIMSEFHPAGRILELRADGGPSRVIAAGLMMPNALQVGPDGLLYFPLVPLGEIWRVALDGSALERVFAGLAFPTAVKFDHHGTLWVTEAATGVVSSIDPATGRQANIRQLAPGIDNLAFTGDGRMIVSYFTDGLIAEVASDGSIRPIVGAGLLGPFGLTVDAEDRLVVADGASIATVDRHGALGRSLMMIEATSPGYAQGISAASDGSLLVTNTAGQVMLCDVEKGARPLAEGFDQLIGVTGDGAGGAIVCEAGAGRVLAIDGSGGLSTLASALDRPTGIVRHAQGGIIVAESGKGRVVHVDNGAISVVLDGLGEPHGLASTAAGLFVLDYATGALHLVPADKSAPIIVASGLPVGSRTGRAWRSLPGIGGMIPGPILRFADLASFADGSVAVGCDATGAVVVLRPTDRP